MKLEKYAKALSKAKSLLESASTVDALNREMSYTDYYIRKCQ